MYSLQELIEQELTSVQAGKEVYEKLVPNYHPDSETAYRIRKYIRGCKKTIQSLGCLKLDLEALNHSKLDLLKTL